VAITHGPGDPAWADQAAKQMAELEGRFNRPLETTTARPESSSTDHAEGVTP